MAERNTRLSIDSLDADDGAFDNRGRGIDAFLEGRVGLRQVAYFRLNAERNFVRGLYIPAKSIVKSSVGEAEELCVMRFVVETEAGGASHWTRAGATTAKAPGQPGPAALQATSRISPN